MLQLLKRILKIIQKKPLGERLRKSTKKGGDYMTELEWAKENHIRNLQNLTNGKSAFENYKDFRERQKQRRKIQREQKQFKVDEKAFNEELCKAAAEELGLAIQKMFK